MPCLMLGLASPIFTACDDDEISGSIIEIPEYEMWDTTEIGKFIYENFTKPYNIRVIYRWENGRQDMGKNLVPPKEEKMIPFLTMLKEVWMEPYVEFLDSADFAKYTVKEMLVSGSKALEESGTVTLGFAEGAMLQGLSQKVVALIGDGAMTGGLAFEGMNNAGASGADILVVLNDNNQSIDGNLGALHEHLLRLTTSSSYNRFKNRVWNFLGEGAFRNFIQRPVQFRPLVFPGGQSVPILPLGGSIAFCLLLPILGPNASVTVQ